MRTTIILEAAWSDYSDCGWLNSLLDNQRRNSQARQRPRLNPALCLKRRRRTLHRLAMLKKKTQKNSVGRGALTVTTAQPVDFRQEEVAYSGGSRVTTDFLYNPIGVLYPYREDDLKCANGYRLMVGILEGR